MKRNRISHKKRIEKKIEFRHKELGFIEKTVKQNLSQNLQQRVGESIQKKHEEKKISMNENDRLRIYGDGKKPVDVKLLTRDEMRIGVNRNVNNMPPYKKKIFVDFDVVICIPSYERYDKVDRLLSQFHSQLTQYRFKLVLLNDGSLDKKYDNLIEKFPDIIYLKNNQANGKVLHWYCYNQMWEYLRDIKCHVILQMDDDFILSDNFLNTIIDLFFEVKENNSNMMAIAPHLWSFKKHVEHESWWKRNDFVDGIALIDDIVIKNMNYVMQPVDAKIVNKVGVPVQAWTQINLSIKKHGGIIYRTENSLVYHDGNEDSKLHPTVRGNGKGVFTQKYVGKL